MSNDSNYKESDLYQKWTLFKSAKQICPMKIISVIHRFEATWRGFFEQRTLRTSSRLTPDIYSISYTVYDIHVLVFTVNSREPNQDLKTRTKSDQGHKNFKPRAESDQNQQIFPNLGLKKSRPIPGPVLKLRLVYLTLFQLLYFGSQSILNWADLLGLNWPSKWDGGLNEIKDYLKRIK